MVREFQGVFPDFLTRCFYDTKIGVDTTLIVQEYQEVWAKVGARLVASAIANAFRGRELGAIAFPAAEFWEEVRQDVLKQLHPLALGMGEIFV